MMKSNLDAVAVTIENTGDTPLIFGQDIAVQSNGIIIPTHEAEYVYSSIKQKPATHLFYLLLSFLQLNIQDGTGQTTDSYPIGVVIGPGLAIGNMAVASTANRALNEDLVAFDLKNKIVQPGQTIGGYIYTDKSFTLNLTLKRINQGAKK